MRIFMGTLRRESSAVVIRAISCVRMVANTRCHVVKNKAEENQSGVIWSGRGTVS